MESIAPPLELLLVVKREIEKGHSVRQGLLKYANQSPSEFVYVVQRWLSLFEQGMDTQIAVRGLDSIYRRALLNMLERGLRGESIYKHLERLEDEIVTACDEEIAARIAKMPFTLLIPLLLFQFPAFLMLLFGPLLQNFFHSFGGG